MNCEEYVIERIKTLESKVEKLEIERAHLREIIDEYKSWEIKVIDVLCEFKFEKKAFENGSTYITSYRFIEGKVENDFEELGLPYKNTITGINYGVE